MLAMLFNLPRSLCIVLALTFGVAGRAAAQAVVAAAPQTTAAGRLEYDGSGEFSHVRVRLRGDLRSMLFVRDTGEEALESRINLKHPQVLQFEYLKHLFTSYLFRPQQKSVLIVGLGGGGMIHFLRHADPSVGVDAVEIDPLVVELADKYFGVRTEGRVRIITADGLKFFSEPRETKGYDVVYMDAFLKPSADTDATGVPLALRTREFYEHVQKKLVPGGLVAFNINPHAGVREDIAAIAAAFPQVYEFSLPSSQGTVVVASMDGERLTMAELLQRAEPLDVRFKGLLHFKEMARRLRK